MTDLVHIIRPEGHYVGMILSQCLNTSQIKYIFRHFGDPSSGTMLYVRLLKLKNSAVYLEFMSLWFAFQYLVPAVVELIFGTIKTVTSLWQHHGNVIYANINPLLYLSIVKDSSVVLKSLFNVTTFINKMQVFIYDKPNFIKNPLSIYKYVHSRCVK